MPRLREKLSHNLAAAYGAERSAELTAFLLDNDALSGLPADALLDRLTIAA